VDLNVVAALNSWGYGIVGFEVTRALVLAGHDVALFPRPVGGADELILGIDDLALVRRALRRTRTYDVDAPCIRIAAENDMSLFAGTGPRAGLTFFETTELSAHELRHLGSLDVIMVASDWGRDTAVGAGLPVDRLRVVPMGVDTAQFPPADLPTDGPTRFLHVGKWEHRKGQDVLLEAFAAAFSPSDDVELSMVSANQLRQDRDRLWHDIVAANPMSERIRVLPREPTREGLAARMAEAHCGVFPARSEGWNLGLVEMLATGRPVIATNYSAHTQYLTPDNARMIEIDELEEARDPRWVPVYSERAAGRWAHLGTQQVEQLVDHLRAVHDDRVAGRLQRNDAGIATAASLSWANTAAAIEAALASADGS
jgi:glycosyltransferase involved in cell wall biosynthesis